jgi:hypothetical protein
LTNRLYLDRGGQFHLLSLSFPSRPVILSEAKDLPHIADNDFSQKNRDIRRARFIAATAD